MGIANKAIWKAYSTVFSIIVAFVTAQLLSRGWKLATGEKPPDPQDPQTPTSKAVGWAVASAVGVVVSQVLSKRYTERHWTQQTGTAPVKYKRKKDKKGDLVAAKPVKVSL